MSVSTLVETVGAANANTWATRAQFRVYVENHPYGTTARAAADADVDRVLLMATTQIVDEWEWCGWPTTLTQALPFPRADLWTVNGAAIPVNVIPDWLIEGQCELARLLLEEDRTADNEIEAQGITALKAGPVDITFKHNVQSKTFPDSIVRKFSRWGYQRSRHSTLKVVRC